MCCDGELIFQFPVFSFVQACRSFHFISICCFCLSGAGQGSVSSVNVSGILRMLEV